MELVDQRHTYNALVKRRGENIPRRWAKDPLVLRLNGALQKTHHPHSTQFPDTMTSTPTPLASTAMEAAKQPQFTPDQLAASEWSRNNWTEGMRIAGADSNYTAFHAFVAGARHFQPLLVKVEAERDAMGEEMMDIRNTMSAKNKEGTALAVMSLARAIDVRYNGQPAHPPRVDALCEIINDHLRDLLTDRGALRADLAAKEAALKRYRETGANIYALWMAGLLDSKEGYHGKCAGEIANLKAIAVLLDEALASRADKGGVR